MEEEEYNPGLREKEPGEPSYRAKVSILYCRDSTEEKPGYGKAFLVGEPETWVEKWLRR